MEIRSGCQIINCENVLYAWRKCDDLVCKRLTLSRGGLGTHLVSRGVITFGDLIQIQSKNGINADERIRLLFNDIFSKKPEHWSNVLGAIRDSGAGSIADQLLQAYLERTYNGVKSSSKTINPIIIGDIPTTNFYVDRENDVKTLQEAFLHTFEAPSNPGVVVLIGEEGCGKTALMAHAIVHNYKILRKAQVEIVLWLNVGSNSLNKLGLYRSMVNLLQLSCNENEALQRLQMHYEDGGFEKILIILDGIKCNDIIPFVTRIGTGLRILASSRYRRIVGSVLYNSNFADFGPQVIRVGILPPEAVRTWITTGDDRKVAVDADNCQHLTRISSCSALLVDFIISKIKACNTQLEFDELTSLMLQSVPPYENQSIGDKISQILNAILSLQQRTFREKCYAFLLFEQGSPISLQDVAILWQCTDDEMLLQFDQIRKVLPLITSVVGKHDSFLLHESLYPALLKFSLQIDYFGQEIRYFRQRILLAIRNSNGENVFHLAVKGKRENLLSVILETLFDTVGKESNYAGNFLLDQQTSDETMETPLHYLHKQRSWLKNENTQWETCFAFETLCRILDGLCSRQTDRPILAIEDANNQTIFHLLQRDIFKTSGVWYRNALLVAATRGYPNLLKELLSIGIVNDVINSVRGYQDHNALMIAAGNNHPSVVEVLLTQSKINVNVRNKLTGETALIIAVSRGHVEVVKQLLTHNDIDLLVRTNSSFQLFDYAPAFKSSGISALAMAIIHGNLELAETLSNAGATLESWETGGLLAMAHVRRSTKLIEAIKKSAAPALANFSLGTTSSNSSSSRFSLNLDAYKPSSNRSFSAPRLCLSITSNVGSNGSKESFTVSEEFEKASDFDLLTPISQTSQICMEVSPSNSSEEFGILELDQPVVEQSEDAVFVDITIDESFEPVIEEFSETVDNLETAAAVNTLDEEISDLFEVPIVKIMPEPNDKLVVIKKRDKPPKIAVIVSPRDLYFKSMPDGTLSFKITPMMAAAITGRQSTATVFLARNAMSSIRSRIMVAGENEISPSRLRFSQTGNIEETDIEETFPSEPINNDDRQIIEASTNYNTLAFTITSAAKASASYVWSRIVIKPNVDD